MMPGESQSKTMAIASDATVGNCQNCSVLHQSLNEYVSSFLALKQKITVSDDTIRLQQQLEELKIKLVTLERKTVDYESMQTELEEKKSSLKVYEQLSGEMENLKQENTKTMAENKKLEDQLKHLEELTETQSCENDHLKREKAKVETDLLKTQTSLSKCQAQADQVEKLIEVNAKTTSIKDNLENKVRLLEDSVCKQNHQISKLNNEKIILQQHIDDLQVRLLKLERERSKEYRSISTQAHSPEEPQVDKEKIRMLLENLWECVEPQQQNSEKLLHLTGDVSSKPYGLCTQLRAPHNYPMQKKAMNAQLKDFPDAQKTIKHQISPQRSSDTRLTKYKKSKQLSKEPETKELSTGPSSTEMSIEEIMEMFKPILSCISPLPDSDTEVETMETDIGEMENHPKLSDTDAVPHKQEAFLPITRSVSNHCSNLSALTVQENVDLPVVTAHKVECISDENDSRGQNNLSGITVMKDNSSSDGKEVDLQKHMQTEPETLQLQSSTSLSESAVLVVAVSLTNESQEPPCTVNPSCNIASSVSETELVLGTAKDDKSDMATKTDANTDPTDVTDARIVTPEERGSLRESGVTRDDEAGDGQLVTTSVFADTGKDTAVSKAKNGSEADETHQECCLKQGSEGFTVLGPQEIKLSLSSGTTHITEDSICLSNSPANFCSVSDKNNEEELKNDGSMNGFEVNDEQRTKRTHSSPESLNITRPQSPKICSLLKMKDADKSHAALESAQGNTETSSQIEDHTEMKNTETVADHGTSLSEVIKTINCESLKENTHSLCRQLSPSCMLPTVKLCPMEPHSNSGKIRVGAEVEHNSTNKKALQLVPSLEEAGIIEEVAVKDFHRETKEASSVASLIQSATCMDEKNKSLEPCTRVIEKQSPNVITEEEASPPATPATDQTPQCIGQVHSEMGPPLPPLLTPLSTPPKVGKSINPRQAIEKLSFPSPMDRLASPTTPVLTHKTPISQHLNSSSLNSPLHPNGLPSSPLQFGSATPKHALPVPGRLPVTTMTSPPSSSSSPSQENSMRILDTMYPELSARARTLSILRGSVGLSICSSDSGTLPTTTDSHVSGFKTINSASTAFTKTETRGEKRQANSLPQIKNRKCPKLDRCSHTADHEQVPSCSLNRGEAILPQTLRLEQLKSLSQSVKDGKPPEENVVLTSLKKIENQCFDLLPVIKSHLYVGSFPKKPVLRDEEKEVISEICQNSLHDVDSQMLSSILNKLKTVKWELSKNYIQALCRVYIGICRQKSYWEKAHILAYTVLMEDFPDADKLILFMVVTWPSVLSHSSLLCQAIHTVTKLIAQEELLPCLSAFLGWEKSPPLDIDQLISRSVSALQSGSNLSFTHHDRYGYDVGDEAWEHVFTLHLLCKQKKWKWTYENLLSKELWPLMNTWVTQPRDQQTPVSDAAVATVLRLIGYLGHQGIKEKCISTVITVANVINTFIQHGQTEGLSWQVQLAAVYCIYHLSPCNPKPALDALARWREEVSQSVPPAVSSCMNQLASICRQVKT